MIRCFRTLVEGVTDYVEFDGNHATRQISIFPEIVLLLEGDEAPEATLNRCDLRLEDEISPQEFQRAWEHYQSLPHSTKSDDSPITRDL